MSEPDFFAGLPSVVRIGACLISQIATACLHLTAQRWLPVSFPVRPTTCTFTLPSAVAAGCAVGSGTCHAFPTHGVMH